MPTDPPMLAARALAALSAVAGPLPRLGIAVSGGGDSPALMYLAAQWAQENGRHIEIASVDHGLRPESAAEAAAVGRAAGSLGLEHAVLRWDGSGSGNLMDRARRARMRLLGEWARDRGLQAVMLGHTLDDQAETLLMRLSRGAGIDGLSAMAPRRQDDAGLWLRPLLSFRRDELRDWLGQIGASWVEDPTNDDARFQRIRIRQAMAQLGLDAEMLALSAQNLAVARDALNSAMGPISQAAVVANGAIRLPMPVFTASPAELQRRFLLAALRFVCGSDYPPRRDKIGSLREALPVGRRVTLDGAVFDPGDDLLIHREPAAARGLDGDIWDNRWNIIGLRDGDVVRALSDDAAAFDWRGAGLRHLEAQSLPAVRRDGIILCPVLDPRAGLSARPIRDKIEFTQILLGH